MTSGQALDAVVAALVIELRAATTLERAAHAVLKPMLAMTQSALVSSAFASSGRVVRATLHLRPDDAYRRLVVLEAGPAAVSDGSADARLTSATAWRWVAEQRRAIAVDVNIGRVEPEGDAAHPISDHRFSGEFASMESRARLLKRDVSHLLALPLRARDGVDGMISLEVDCRAAMGKSFIWGACRAQLQLLADVAAASLASLPVEAAAPVTDPFLPVVGAAMTPIVALLRVFVQQDDPILISGPTGTGKSRLARYCHEHSAVRGGPFEMLDLSAMPEELQLAELFGWRKGAFTGAVRDNPGVMARAKGGTLFIDEIDNLSPRAQAGLLRVLEERTYRVLGDDAGEREADVRFIVGTNASLHEAVREKRFREDLYYRINVLPVKLPSLRERADEIPRWAEMMLARHHAKRATGRAVLSPSAEAVLAQHSWPGNLRELDNVLRRAYAIALMARVTANDLAVDEEHVRHALAYDRADAPSSLVDALVAAAAAFVAEAEKRPIDLDLADAFKGFVLGAAAEKVGGADAAFKLFGRERLVASRNHHKVMKREMERVDALCAATGEERSPFAGVAGEDEG
jgi:DNA-binding NtrC family response regulator